MEEDHPFETKRYTKFHTLIVHYTTGNGFCIAKKRLKKRQTHAFSIHITFTHSSLLQHWQRSNQNALNAWVECIFQARIRRALTQLICFCGLFWLWISFQFQTTIWFLEFSSRHNGILPAAKPGNESKQSVIIDVFGI